MDNGFHASVGFDVDDNGQYEVEYSFSRAGYTGDPGLFDLAGPGRLVKTSWTASTGWYSSSVNSKKFPKAYPFKVTEAQYNSALEAANDPERTKWYNSLTYNCRDYSKGVADAAGADLPPGFVSAGLRRILEDSYLPGVAYPLSPFLFMGK